MQTPNHRAILALPVTIIGLLMTACAGSGPPPYQTGQREPISLRDDDDGCGMSLVQSFVGLRANDAVRGEVARQSGAGSLRWVRPGEAVTMDFRADRITAELDEDDVIRTLRCG
ncbi:MAG: peptidase inhibitor I78 [Sphingomonadales bacterium]|nr:peptidase inhibitor I78 [Sphingomonadales bacterium]